MKARIVHQDSMELNALRQFDQELGVAIEMMNLDRVALCEGGHRLDVRPVGDSREPRFLVPVLAKELDAEGNLLKRRNALG